MARRGEPGPPVVLITAVTLPWVGGALAIIGGVLWIIAALVSPVDVVWPFKAGGLIYP